MCSTEFMLDVFERVVAGEPSSMPTADLRALLSDIAKVRAFLDAREATALSEVSTRPDMLPSYELTRVGARAADARRTIERSTTVEAAPVFGEALEAGRVSSAHVDALGVGLRMLGDRAPLLLERTTHLLERAETLGSDDFQRVVRREAEWLAADRSVERLERQRRRTHLRIWNESDGMIGLSGRFDPERGSVVVSLLERAVETMFHAGDAREPVDCAPDIDPNDHRRAIALVASLQSAADGARVVSERPSRAEIVVHIDFQTLVSGLGEGSVLRTATGASLPVETVRRLACEADIIPVVLDGESMPLDVGRSKRLATAPQRRALAARYTTCAMPDRPVAFHRCEPHHLTPWESGGGTDLANLLPLCSRHHHLVHEGGWTLHVDSCTGEVTPVAPGSSRSIRSAA